MPGPWRVAHDCFTGQAIEREVTVGGALGVDELRAEIRQRIGESAELLPEACAELVDTTLRYWPERAMADYARRPDSSGRQVINALPVITAKVREVTELRWGENDNVRQAVDLLADAVAVELANYWFASVENRIDMRRAIWQVRQG